MFLLRATKPEPTSGGRKKKREKKMKEHLIKYPKVLAETESVIVYGSGNSAIAYLKSRSKSSWHYHFKSEEKALEYARNWAYTITKNLLEREETKKAVREKLKKFDARESNHLGKIFHRSWGYEQTNNDYYQVVKILSKTKALVKKCSIVTVKDLGAMSSMVKPGEVFGDAFSCTIREKEIVVDGRGAWEWDGKEDYDSCYA